MERNPWRHYGVKLVYQAHILGEPKFIDENYQAGGCFYEESVVMVKAKSFDHAYQLAEHCAVQNEIRYRNLYGQVVQWRLVEAIDCFVILEEPGEVSEVYSSVTTSRLGVREYMEQRYGHCLGNDAENYRRSQVAIRRQYILRAK